MLNDREIIDLYIKRDESAISETAEKYGAYCEKIAYNILMDKFDSEECVNDTYMHTWNNVPPTLPRILSAFLAKITRNIAIDRYKSKTAKKRSYEEHDEKHHHSAVTRNIVRVVGEEAVVSSSRMSLEESHVTCCKEV